MCNKAGGAGVIGCNARDGLGPLSAHAHGITCNKACITIGCNARDGISLMSACGHGAGGAGVIGCNARDGIGPMSARGHDQKSTSCIILRRACRIVPEEEMAANKRDTQLSVVSSLDLCVCDSQKISLISSQITKHIAKPVTNHKKL
jgi:hypothetical protein